jgi:hypothetical protein
MKAIMFAEMRCELRGMEVSTIELLKVKNECLPGDTHFWIAKTPLFPLPRK